MREGITRENKHFALRYFILRLLKLVYCTHRCNKLSRDSLLNKSSIVTIFARLEVTIELKATAHTYVLVTLNRTQERFSIKCHETKTKAITMANHKKLNNTMNQWELEANTRDQRQARENACDQVAIGFGFVSDWLRRWRDFLKPITERSKAKRKQFSDYFRHSIENRSIS